MVENSQRAFRLLIVETEVAAALLIKRMLREMGALAVGPAFNVRQAEHLAACCEVDGALLNVHVDGDEPPFSVAATLRQRGIPFIFVTERDLPGLDDVPTLRKPFSRADLSCALRTHFGLGLGNSRFESATPASETPLPPSSLSLNSE